MTADALHELLKAGRLEDHQSRIVVTGSDPVYPTRYRIGQAAATALAAQSAAIAAIWQDRSGRSQDIAIDTAAAAMSLEAVLMLRQRGYAVPYPDVKYPLTAFHPCKDGRSIFLHAGYPYLRDGLLKLLDCPNDSDAINKAVAKWDAFKLEDAVADLGLCGGVARSREEWLKTPQGALLADMPVVSITRIGDGEAKPFAPAARPLSDVRVLDLTHVLAGPTATRTLAEQGATVLRIRPPAHPTIPSFVMDTGHGKLSTLLDLTQKADHDCLWKLIGNADVFAESYRPGALDKLGFSPEDLASHHPGIVYLSLSCYGETGDWGTRRGWEQLAQSVSGMAVGEGSLSDPQLSPVYPNDYITGYLGAFGITAALRLRAAMGGSYHVKVALCRTAMWIQSLGHVQSVPPSILVPPGTAESLALQRETAYGRLSYLGPVPRFSETRPYWELPTAPMAAHEAAWPAMPSAPSGPPVPVNAGVPH
ncbi:MAG TPA: CoA transferase [Candidatus Sulfotelmatobacter sp.]|jgi:crotonobetainyl-CoA:carnitine CoA-transferase CaiB-like acyl-CoA transferase|nr:CoA transferase [Candidatus Sulfotelmatobacter sp.]